MGTCKIYIKYLRTVHITMTKDIYVTISSAIDSDIIVFITTAKSFSDKWYID